MGENYSQNDIAVVIAQKVLNGSWSISAPTQQGTTNVVGRPPTENHEVYVFDPVTNYLVASSGATLSIDGALVGLQDHTMTVIEKIAAEIGTQFRAVDETGHQNGYLSLGHLYQDGELAPGK